MTRNAVVGLFGAVLIACGVIAPASAHHVPAAKFDPAKPVTVTGRVTKVEWLNPHVHIFVNAQGTNPPESWAIELESTVDLKRSGWSRDTVKVGDMVTVRGTAARDGSTTAWGDSVVVGSTGRRVFTVTLGAAARSPGATDASLARRTTKAGPAARSDHGLLGVPDRDDARPAGRQRSSGRARHAAEHRRHRQGRSVSALGEGPVRAAPAEFPERRSDVHLLQAAGGAADLSGSRMACSSWKSEITSASG